LIQRYLEPAVLCCILLKSYHCIQNETSENKLKKRHTGSISNIYTSNYIFKTKKEKKLLQEVTCIGKYLNDRSNWRKNCCFCGNKQSDYIKIWHKLYQIW
jgi:hypothetical protein